MPQLGPRKRMTDDEIQQAYAEARRRMRAGSAAASPQPTSGMLTGGRVALDLGQRQNTSQGPRAGQQFRDYVSGGQEYHQYAGGPTVAVKARAPEQVRQALFAAHSQPQQTAARQMPGSGQDVQDRLTQLAQAYAQRGRTQEQPQNVGRQLMATAARHRYPPDATVLLPRPHDIKQFQQFHHLPVTGVVDAATKRKMRQVNSTMATGALGYGGPH